MNKRLIGAAVCAGIVLTACGSGSSATSSTSATAATVTATAISTQKTTATKVATKTVTAASTQRLTTTKNSTATVTATVTETERPDATGAVRAGEDSVMCAVATVLFDHQDAVEKGYASGANQMPFVTDEAQHLQDALDGVSYFLEGGGIDGLQLAEQWRTFRQKSENFIFSPTSMETYAAARQEIRAACSGLTG